MWLADGNELLTQVWCGVHYANMTSGHNTLDVFTNSWYNDNSIALCVTNTPMPDDITPKIRRRCASSNFSFNKCLHRMDSSFTMPMRWCGKGDCTLTIFSRHHRVPLLTHIFDHGSSSAAICSLLPRQKTNTVKHTGVCKRSKNNCDQHCNCNAMHHCNDVWTSL